MPGAFLSILHVWGHFIPLSTTSMSQGLLSSLYQWGNWGSEHLPVFACGDAANKWAWVEPWLLAPESVLCVFHYQLSFTGSLPLARPRAKGFTWPIWLAPPRQSEDTCLMQLTTGRATTQSCCESDDPLWLTQLSCQRASSSSQSGWGGIFEEIFFFF